MTKSVLQKLALLVVIFVFVAGSVLVVRSATDSATAYNVPRMLGAGEPGETIRRSGAPTTGVEGPFIGESVSAVVMNTDLRDLPQTGPDEKSPMREMGKFDGMRTATEPDPVVQTRDRVADQLLGPLAPAPAPLMNFKGLDLDFWGSGWPPDTHGDVGPDHYIQVVNTAIGVYSKTTGARLAAFTFDNLFSGTGTSCDGDNQGDPVALYDEISGRWILTDFAWTNIMSGPYYECIAVSQTADPVSGGWYFYALRADDDAHPWLNDYPKLGLWSDGIYMSANLFDCLDSGCNYANYMGAKVWALNRDDMISGASLRSISFLLGDAYYSLLPSNLKGALPPSDTPAYFMADDWYNFGTRMNLWKFHTNWAVPASSTFSSVPQSVVVASFTDPSGEVSQWGSPETLDTLGDRLMTWLQYRNIGGTESLWVSRTVDAGASLGIRWMEVRNMGTTPSVYQQGTYAPDSNDRWMPSLAVNQQGDMAVGYSVSSASRYPAIRYAGRLAGDPLGTLGQTERTLINGTGSQNGGYTRWGDYSSMSVDPADDCTFWYTTEYYETISNNWQTRISAFRLPGCGTTVDSPPSVFITSPNATVSGTVTITASAQDDHGLTQVEFFVDGVSLGVDSNSADGWSMSWNTTASGNGAHALMTTATDTIGQTESDTIHVTVVGAVTGPSIHVADLDGTTAIRTRASTWKAVITILVHDGNQKPLSRVTVNFTWSGGYNYSGTCRTGLRGTCKVKTPYVSMAVPTISLEVTNLTKTGYTYVPAQNTDPDGDSNGIIITVTP